MQEVDEVAEVLVGGMKKTVAGVAVGVWAGVGVQVFFGVVEGVQ